MSGGLRLPTSLAHVARHLILGGPGLFHPLWAAAIPTGIIGVHFQDGFLGLLGYGGMVVLQDEPLDVVSPAPFLLHGLGLDTVLLFAVLIVGDSEAERVSGAFDQHQ